MLQRLETKSLILARTGLRKFASRWPSTKVLRSLPMRVRPANLREIGALRLSFLVCVILPTLIAAVYLGLFASQQYASEARFAIRTAEHGRLPSMLEGLSALSSLGAGGRSTTQDAFMVTDYIHSRTLIEDVGGRTLMEQLYARSDVDWWSRLRKARTIEKIWKYWRTKVTATIDTPSGIITLETIAFTPEDAHRLAQLIVDRSETLVNDISQRSRRDTLARAESELDLARERVRKAREALLAFRNANKSIDPVANAVSIGETIRSLMQQKSKLENDRASLVGAVSEESPVKRQLDARITNLDSQIAGLQEQLTTQSQNPAISGEIASYEALQLETQFAEKLYAVNQAAYEQARVEQERQQLYLATIVKPTMPQEASYPRLKADSAVVFVVCFVLWSMASLLIAAIRDHMGN